MTAHSAAMAVLSATLFFTSEVEAAGGCQLVRIAEWRTRPGYASPVVDGTINGVKVGVMLDTGAERTMIMRSAAQRLNLVPPQPAARADSRHENGGHWWRFERGKRADSVIWGR